MEDEIYSSDKEKMSIAQPIIEANRSVLHSVRMICACHYRILTICLTCSISHSINCVRIDL